MLDPNSTIPHAREVRVTMRGVRITDGGRPVQVSTRSDFIAPELSAPSTTALEQDKGKAGWTNKDVTPVDHRDAAKRSFMNRRAELIAARAQAILDDATCGKTVISTKAPQRELRVLNRQGPAHRRMF
jgi:hypothetical protein